ncbi:class I SAM-dependent methyltransferase [Flavobacteriaceae bacterium MHTCC 0001]
MIKIVTKYLNYFKTGRRFFNNNYYLNGKKQSALELEKTPTRTDIINYLISILDRDITYLEIGVRNPSHNLNLIKAKIKYGVDPGVEFKENPVDFKMTSDEFFSKLDNGEQLNKDIKFDIIFIDGLHLATQVDRDIQNALRYIKEDGFIVLHDCNPPTEWHTREEYRYLFTPAGGYWNGTTWKAFLKWRTYTGVYSCCVNTDWGVGLLSKKQNIGKSTNIKNDFFEFSDFSQNRSEYLNLMSFEKFKTLFK